ncbi:thiosulfate oxidation carrier protein SoxY [Paucibacter sp. DJ1R-11]|uniref:thiosulfate oxidation carrier protein SoxY n=1 Tax=Paucibacter sp. DJ1R-11 TaxID=2893556 RepID=UPI0021E433C5|nr:thiosulfate oxidation carrier protein SoxY [Paucibacter sp. DJ1R-11]MCV2363968.1 thiosulfate oxidation carrier protein SoxY [Paucibacter sp. DJ1R-11]
MAALLLGGGALPEWACAQAPSPVAARVAFDAKTLNEAVAALGYAAPVESRDVSIQAPDIAEDGASVLVTAACSQAGVKQIMFLLDSAPTALAAVFNLGADIEAEVSTRLRLARSSVVFAVAITQDKKVLFAQKEVKVAMGACGADAKPARGLRADGVSSTPVRC